MFEMTKLANAGRSLTVAVIYLRCAALTERRLSCPLGGPHGVNFAVTVFYVCRSAPNSSNSESHKDHINITGVFLQCARQSCRPVVIASERTHALVLPEGVRTSRLTT